MYTPVTERVSDSDLNYLKQSEYNEKQKQKEWGTISQKLLIVCCSIGRNCRDDVFAMIPLRYIVNINVCGQRYT